MVREKEMLMTELREERDRTANPASKENSICLFPGVCLDIPSFGGFSSGLFILGLILGVSFGSVCAGKCNIDICTVFRFCCPDRCLSVQKEDGDQDIHIYMDGGKMEKEGLKESRDIETNV
jgi:hypothetical protein